MILIDIALLAIWLYSLYLANQNLRIGYLLSLVVPIVWACYELWMGKVDLVVTVVAFGLIYTFSMCVLLKLRHTRYYAKRVVELHKATGPRKLYFELDPAPDFSNRVDAFWTLKDEDGSTIAMTFSKHVTDHEAIIECAKVFTSTLADGRVRVVIEDPETRDRVFEVISKATPTKGPS